MMRRPSLTDLGSATASRLRDGADRTGEVLAATRDRWLALDVYSRRRIALGGLAALGAVAVLIAVLVLPAAPCDSTGGTCGSDDRALALAPSDSLAYVHVDIDAGSPQYRAAATIERLFPVIGREAVTRLEAPLTALPAAGLAPGDQRASWLGGEAAVAVLPGVGGPPAPVELLAAASEGEAKRFAASLVSGSSTLTYRGIEVLGGAALSAALVDGFLAVGPRAGVQRVIDVAAGAGGARSLAADGTALDTRSQLPAARLADLYLSHAGIGRLVASPGAPLAALSAIVPPSSTGLALSLAAGDGALTFSARTSLPSRAPSSSGSPLTGLAPFHPTLAARLPAGTLAYLGAGPPSAALDGLLGGLGGSTPAIVRALLGGLPRADIADLQRSLLPALGSEAALALGAPPTANGVPAGPPHLEFVAAGVDVKRARAALAALRVPLPSAVTAGRLMVAGDRVGLSSLQMPGDPLAAAPAFSRATEGLASAPSLLGYVNIARLVPLFEAAGLAENPAYASFAPEIQRLEAFALSAESSPGALRVDARLTVSG